MVPFWGLFVDLGYKRRQISFIETPQDGQLLHGRSLHCSRVLDQYGSLALTNEVVFGLSRLPLKDLYIFLNG